MAIEIITPVNDDYVPKVQDILKLFAGLQITVRVGSHRLRLVNSFIFPEQGETENDLAYATRLQNKFWLNNVQILENDIAHQRIAGDLKEIDTSVVDVPEEMPE